MRSLVIYESNTGFTKQYAQWIAQALRCECAALKTVSPQRLTGVDSVIFGGWIMGNTIMGLDRVRKLAVQPAAVFAVGCSQSRDEVVEAIRTQNQLGDTPLFYMEGGFRFEELGFVQRTMLKMVKKAAAKKEHPSAQDREMAEVLGTSFDHSDQSAIRPLVEFIG